MSVDKLLAQAEKLLDKGKTEEALEKLQAAFTLDVNNELVANKLARTFADLGKKSDAVNIYKQLGARASLGGKAQKAVAFFKQGLEIDPDNIHLLEQIAPEAEAIGKVSEAVAYAQKVVAYYIPRKKYLDALSAFALMARIQPNDESIRAAWIELLMYVRLETHLQRALICLCGPPGLALPEFPVGGDPTKLSPALQQALIDLLPFFPTDPMLPYALAWVCYKQGRDQEMFGYLLNSYKKDPNFCLTLLLIGRVLAEKKLLSETLFVYKYIKDMLPADRSVDFRTLNQQVSNFEEKNGWLNFAEGFGGQAAEMSPDEFLAKISGEEPVEESDGETDDYEADGNENGEEPDIFGARGTQERKIKRQKNSTNQGEEKRAELPAEVALGMPEPEAEGSLVIQFTGDATRVIDTKSKSQEAESPVAAEPISKANKTEGPRYSASDLKEDVAEEKPLEDETNPKPTAEDQTKFLSPLELLDAQRNRPFMRIPRYRKPVEAKSSRLDPPSGADHEASKIFARPEPQENEGDKTIDMAEAVAKLPEPEVVQSTATETIAIAETASTPLAAETAPDLGDDLLEQPTATYSKTESKAEISRPLQSLPDPSVQLLEKAALYLAKKEYFLARQAYRRAESLGADKALVAEKLKEIRNHENPRSLYTQESTDRPNKQLRNKILRDLELEVGSFDDRDAAAELEMLAAIEKIRPQINQALSEASPQVRVDLGIAFFEMGLYGEAGNQFEQAGKDDSDIKRNVDYLRAQALFRSKDYPSAVSLLKSLSADQNISQSESLAIFYLLAEIYEEMEQPKRSKKYFQKVAELDANYRSVREKLESD